MPIILLNRELKILAQVSAKRLQLVISALIGPEQNYLHLVLEGLKDGTEAALINLDHSKAFDRVDYRLLATVWETAGFKPEFRKWISDADERKPLEVFVIEHSVGKTCSSLLFSISSLWTLAPYA